MNKTVENSIEPLIQLKKEILDKISRRYEYFLPPYFRFNVIIFKYFRIPIWIQFFIWIPLITILNYFIDITTGASVLFKDFWLYFAFGVLILLFAFLSIWYIWNKHLNTFGNILELLTDNYQIIEIEKSFNFMYKSKYQFIVIAFFFFLAMFTVIPLYPQINSLLRFYTVLSISLAASTAGIGTWLAATSCYFIHQISRFTNLNINILFPGQDINILKLSRLFSSYSTLFAIEVLFWITPYTILLTTMKSRGIPFDTTSPSHLCGSIFLLLTFLFFMPSYFLYPQKVLKKIVYERKSSTISSIHRFIDKLYQDLEQNNHNLNLQNCILEYTKLLQTVSSAPTLKIISTPFLQFASPLVISIFLTIAGNPVISVAIKNFIKWTYQNIKSIG